MWFATTSIRRLKNTLRRTPPTPRHAQAGGSSTNVNPRSLTPPMNESVEREIQAHRHENGGEHLHGFEEDEFVAGHGFLAGGDVDFGYQGLTSGSEFQIAPGTVPDAQDRKL